MIELSVSDVRAALMAKAGAEDRGSGEAATLLLGRVFHEVFADLVSTDAERSGLRVITLAGPTRERRIEALLEHTWRKILAPRLLRHAAQIQTTSEPVAMLWRAVEQLAGWLSDVVVELLRQTGDHEALTDSGVQHLGALLRAEVPLACDLREPTWGERVRLVGLADSILKVPGRPALCAIELKLGRALPPVDLGQAALYRLILVRSGAQPADAALALLRFSPDLEEQIFHASMLAEAETKLLDVIADLARVPRIEPRTESRTDVGSGILQDTPPPPVVHAVIEPVPGVSPHAQIGRSMVRACREYGVGIDLKGEPVLGPRFLRFDVRLSQGAKLSALERVMPEVAHRLTLAQEPMVTQEAGSLFVDVARPDPQTVPFASIVSQLPAVDPLVGSARMPIGVDSAGRLLFADLASSGRSHALVAGGTGSGKTEWLRMALAGLLASNTPDTLRLITIDPKLMAFGDLEHSRFLLRPDAFWIPTRDGRDATEIFDDLVEEMDRRYHLVHAAGADNLADYVKKTRRPLPRIVCVCDEYGALLAQSAAKKSIEGAVTLLGSKARAAGIHLVLATQQPSRAVISGAIQTNLPCRVALALNSHIESNMILGEAGAERLTGQGDLLYKDFGNPVRLQAPLLSELERRQRFTA